MCGILFLYEKNGINNKRKINFEKALKSKGMQKRGPDSTHSIRVSKNFLIGHTRLSILDLTSKSKQPLESFNKRYLISFNGEIFNYKELTKYLFEKLGEIDDLKILGPNPLTKPDRGPLATFFVKGIHSNDIAELLDNSNICIRSGHHCCQPLHRFYGIQSTARASLSFISTPSEIDSLTEELKSIIAFLKKNS